MYLTHDLEPQECERLLREGRPGKVAFTTPEGPQIVPVGYSVFEDTIVMRVGSYSALGSYGRNAMLAFEVGQSDSAFRSGWSVLARGRSWVEIDPAVVRELRAACPTEVWGTGSRMLCLRLRWDSLVGQRLGGESAHDSDAEHPSEATARRTLSAL